MDCSLEEVINLGMVIGGGLDRRVERSVLGAFGDDGAPVICIKTEALADNSGLDDGALEVPFCASTFFRAGGIDFFEGAVAALLSLDFPLSGNLLEEST
jgi:hypothetical protein